MLNISVDTADLNPEGIPENLSINDQESIVEIVVEKILGYEDAFKEYDDNDTEDHTKKSNLKIEIMAPRSLQSAIDYSLVASSEKTLFDYHSHLSKGFQKILTPPPKA